MKKINFLLSILIFIALSSFTTRVVDAESKSLITYDSYLTSNIPSDYYENIDLSETKEEIIVDLEKTISENYVSYDYDTINEYMKETDPILGEDSENTKYCRDMYTGQKVSRYNDYDASDYPDGESKKNHVYDREHCWPKSYGFPDYKNTPAGTDMHHIRPAMATINQSYHNNYFYGEMTNCTNVKTLYGNSVGDYNGEKIFEPSDEVKGDIARMLFYMSVRYRTASENQLALSLVNRKTGSATETEYDGELGDLETLLKWAEEDPVSSIEIHRNEVIYKYQQNRNPFIDHPEYTYVIFDSEPTSIEDMFASTVTNSKLKVTYKKESIVTNDHLKVSTEVNLENLESTSSLEEAVSPATIDQSSSKVNSHYGTKEDSIKGVKLGTSSVEGKLILNYNSNKIIYDSLDVTLSPWQGSGLTTGAVSETTAKVVVTDNSGKEYSKTILLDSSENKTLTLDLNSTVKKISIEGGTNNRVFVHSFTLKDSGTSEDINYDLFSASLMFGFFDLSNQFYNKFLEEEVSFGVVYSNQSITIDSSYESIEEFLSKNTSARNLSLNVLDKNNNKNSLFNTALEYDSSSTSLSSLNDTVYARTYMLYNGQLYFMKEASFSINSLSNLYLNNYLEENSVKENQGILKYIIMNDN